MILNPGDRIESRILALKGVAVYHSPGIITILWDDGTYSYPTRALDDWELQYVVIRGKVTNIRSLYDKLSL